MSIQMDILYDRSESIRSSIHDVQFTLLLSCALVVLVIWLFLRNLSATVIPALAVPLSVLGAVPVMYLLDYSLDNLSLLALTLAVGFVVDDAIVMMENIVRHMEQGMSAMQAARKGAREIGFTIISLTISLVAVLIPLLFMGDVVGRLFHEFALTLAITIIISDNLTTGMTGGQDSAGTGRLEQICAGIGVEPEHIRVVVPLPRNREEMKRIIREEIAYPGVSVIIPRRECIQTAKRHNAKK